MKKVAQFQAFLAGSAISAAALAQTCPSAPTPSLDVGTLTAGAPLTASVTVPASAVAWVKFTLAGPVRLTDLTFLNVTTGGATIDTELAVYDCAGNLLATDDDDEEGQLSALSFGSGNELFAGTGGVVSNGRDGALSAGVYYLAVTRSNSTFTLTNFGAVGVASGIGQSIPVHFSLGATLISPMPPGTIDLGTMSATDTRVRTGEAISENEVRWFKVRIPAASSSTFTFFDADTEGSTLAPTNITRIAIYTATGVAAGSLSPATRTNPSAALSDTTDGTNNLSQLSLGIGARPAPGNGLEYNGRDGDIQAGTYFIGVAGPGVQPNAINTTSQSFGFFSESPNAGTFNLRLSTGVQQNVAPSGTGSATGCVITATGGTLSVIVNVALGGNPASTGTTVTLNASQIGLGSMISLINGGNNTYTTVLNAPPGVAPSTYQLPVVVADAQGRSTTFNLPVVVASTNANESITQARVPSGSGTLSAITGTIIANQADLYRIQICDPANFLATTVGGANWDTQLFLFRENGTGVTSNDDTVGDIVTQSTLTSQFVSDEPVGEYILAISRSNRDPISDPCNTQSQLWPGFNARVESEPINPLPMVSWTNTTFLPPNPDYSIALTGACYPSVSACDSIDFNRDGVFPDSDDIADYLSVFGGGPCSNGPNCGDLDFNNDGVFPDSDDIGAFLRVFGGGQC